MPRATTTRSPRRKLTIEGRGSLLPEKRQITYAPVAGIVVDVPVENGQLIKKGDLLARLYSPELEKEKKKLLAEMQAALTQSNYLSIQVDKARTSGNEQEEKQLSGQRAEANQCA